MTIQVRQLEPLVIFTKRRRLSIETYPVVSKEVLLDLLRQLFQHTFFLGLVVINEENTIVVSREILDDWIVCICGKNPYCSRAIDLILTATILILS